VPADIRDEAEPVEILEERSFQDRSTANAVVVFDSEQDSATKRARHAPDVEGIHDMSQVQVPCRGRCKSRDRRSIEPCGKREEVWASRHETIVVEVRCGEVR
jgi:hypothetical protein